MARAMSEPRVGVRLGTTSSEFSVPISKAEYVDHYQYRAAALSSVIEQLRSENEALKRSWDIDAEHRDELLLEVERLRQGLWDIGMLAGMDCDGLTTPEYLASDIVELVKGEVADLRAAYDEVLADE